jgi:uncharacterized protein YllA (UPF0747 family)
VIKLKSIRIDKGIEGTVGAESRKIEKSLENIQKKVVRALKHKNEVGINKIEKIYSMVWPAGKFQERHDSIFDLFQSPNHISAIIADADPVKNSLLIFKI